MKRTARPGAALLLLLLVALPARAQEPDSDPGKPPSSATAETNETDGAGRATAQNDPEADSPADPAPGNRTPEPGESPLDYRPSEQISEDRSVSFPVDI